MTSDNWKPPTMAILEAYFDEVIKRIVERLYGNSLSDGLPGMGGSRRWGSGLSLRLPNRYYCFYPPKLSSHFISIRMRSYSGSKIPLNLIIPCNLEIVQAGFDR